MLTHLLDTSAWLAHLLGEPGAHEVTALFEDAHTAVGISVLSIVELQGRLRATDRGVEFKDTLELYRQLFDAIVPANEAVALRATDLREVASTRLPAIDSLIAATAAVHDAVLVHRDPHFRAIPAERLTQQVLDGS
jgi:predicted nucleic acid-binding protein